MAAMSASARPTLTLDHTDHAHEPERQPVGGEFFAQVLRVDPAERRRLARAENPDVQYPEGNDQLQGNGEIFHGLKVTTSELAGNG